MPDRADRYRTKRATKHVEFEPVGPTSETQLVIRMPLVLMAKIDEEAARMQASNPGLSISRSDAARSLLIVGIRAREAKGGK